MTDAEPVLLRFDDSVAVVSFNRPQRHNAANDAMDAAFFDVLEQLHGNDAVRAIMLRGEGPSISANHASRCARLRHAD